MLEVYRIWICYNEGAAEQISHVVYFGTHGTLAIQMTAGKMSTEARLERSYRRSALPSDAEGRKTQRPLMCRVLRGNRRD